MSHLNIVKKIAYISVLAALPLFFTSCVNLGHSYGMGPMGAIFAKGTIGVSGNSTQEAQRVGRACAHRIGIFVYGLAAFGDGSIMSAVNSVAITKVHRVDKEYFNVLGIYSNICTVVHGE